MLALNVSDETSLPRTQDEHTSRSQKRGMWLLITLVVVTFVFVVRTATTPSEAQDAVQKFDDYVEPQQFEYVDSQKEKLEVISDTRRVDTIADTRRVETIADTRRVDTIADTRRVDTVADTRRVETIADTRRVEAIADTRRVRAADTQFVGTTSNVEAIDDTRRVETIADTRRIETIADTRRVSEVIADTRRVDRQTRTVAKDQKTIKTQRRRGLVHPLNYSAFESTIFVSMPSYRDSQCWRTIVDAFEQASNPNRIFFGIFQQHGAAESDCGAFDNILGCSYERKRRHPLCGRSKQVSIKRVHYNGSRGLPYSRYHAEQFYKRQDFVLQIDAHTRFVTNWDDIAIKAFNALGNERGVLSSYPKATNDDWLIPKETNRSMSVGICGGELKKSRPMCKVIKPLGGQLLRLPGRSVMSPYFAGGLSFSRGHRLENVPSDPYLKYMFEGEEIGMSVRLWTHGYDLYTPNVDLIFHVYGSQMGGERKVFWRDAYGDEKKKMTRLAYWRLHYIMGTLDTLLPGVSSSPEKMGMIDLREAEKYGCGSRRDKKQFWEWAQFDLMTGRSGNVCFDLANGGLERKPIL